MKFAVVPLFWHRGKLIVGFEERSGRGQIADAPTSFNRNCCATQPARRAAANAHIVAKQFGKKVWHSAFCIHEPWVPAAFAQNGSDCTAICY